MKIGLFAIVAGTAVATGAFGQSLVLDPGDLEFRIIADNTLVSPGSNFVQLAMQVRYVGGDVRVMSLAGTRGRIASGEADAAGVLDRAGVRDLPFGTFDFGPAARRGMTGGLRELFSGGGGANNNADENGGNPGAASGGNPHNGGGEFRWAPGLAGFGNLLAFDVSTSGVGRDDFSGDGTLISIGLIDDNNGSGDDTGVEPTAGITTDQSRWDTVFMFSYTVTDFTARTISFDYQNKGSTAYPGASEDAVWWWSDAQGNPRFSNVAPGVFRDDLSDNITVVPAPGAVALLALGGLVAARRRR